MGDGTHWLTDMNFLIIYKKKTYQQQHQVKFKTENENQNVKNNQSDISYLKKNNPSN